MRLSGNRFIETFVSQRAKTMVTPIKGEIPFTLFVKDPKNAIFALITTAGVHLKTQEIFNVEAGDPSVRFISSNTCEDALMISHTHFDRADADQDINCVFPITRLNELADDGLIGGVANTHYGLMGFIPEPTALVKETIPIMIKKLLEEKVDAVILNPG